MSAGPATRPLPTLPALPGALEARAAFVRALEGALPGELLVVDVPAPAAPVERLLAARPGRGLLWAPPDGVALAGLGSAAQLTAEGEARMAVVQAAAAALWARLRVVSAGAPAPRLFGGFAFSAERAAGAPWSEFPGAAFTLPRWRYARDGARAWLSFAAEGAELGAATARAAAVDELDGLLSALSRRRPGTPELADGADAPPPDEPRAGFEARVAAICAALAAGQGEKVVAARAVTLELPAAASVSAVLARLAARAPWNTRFAFRELASAFLGATPERLVALHGREVRCDALAGTARGGAEAALLASRKDHIEHAPVVRAIAAALEPRCVRLEVAARPALRPQGELVHLHTTLHGELAAPSHLLELAAALHPTPAVGGAPRDFATRWIAAHEPAPRGWYAGPVGWFDAAGNGELMVALRCGVLSAGGRRATLFAGAGIVADSRPAAEWAETELKLGGLRGALLEAAAGDPA